MNIVMKYAPALRHLSALSLLTFLASFSACSPDDGNEGPKETLDYPTDHSVMRIEAFLDGETYKSEPWIGDSAVRTSEDAWAHGNALRVYFNTAAVEAKVNETTTAVGAMAVKEFYDDAGTLVGKAATLKINEGMAMSDVVFYCTAEEGSNLCTGNSATGFPLHGEGISECGSCHGGETLLSPMPQ